MVFWNVNRLLHCSKCDNCMNIIILSAAAKIPLIEAFKEAAANINAKVFTADLSAECTASYFGDGHFIVPRSDNDTFIGAIIKICVDNEIGLIIPTRDGELPILAHSLPQFKENGIFIHCPSPQTLANCQNKREFNTTISQIELKGIPELDAKGDFEYPVFIRPVSGAGGRGAYKVYDKASFPRDFDTSATMLTPFIDAQEYSIDLLMDLQGESALAAIARERNYIQAGEAKITTTRDLPELCAAAMRLGEHLGLVGHNVVQAFYENGEEPIFIEVNPRFGGASNCAIKAGLESPLRIIEMLQSPNQPHRPFILKYDTQMHRYSKDMFIDV